MSERDPVSVLLPTREWGDACATLASTLLTLVFPFLVASSLTLGFAAIYARLGVRRWTFLLAFPGYLLLPVVALVSHLTPEFDWAGRRYRFGNDGSVDVLD